MSELNDIKIAGNGTVTGGEYNNIKISGAGKVDGDCTAKSVHISGSGTLSGKCKADKINVSGYCNLCGSVKTKVLKIAGGAKLQNDIEADLIKVSGSLKSEGNITGGDINIAGRVNCEKDIKCKTLKVSGVLDAVNVESEDFVVRGLIKIENMLNSENIDIILETKSNIGEIGGKTIKIVGSHDSKPLTKIISVFTGNKGAIVLDTNFIEGDEIYLENIKVKEVSGQNVVVGKYCVIDKVSYTKSLNIADGAVVKQKEQI